MMLVTDSRFLIITAALALAAGSYVLLSIHRPRFQGYRKVRLHLVNAAMCAAASIGIFALLLFLYIGRSEPILSLMSQACWIIGVLLTIVHSRFSLALRTVSAAILIGYPIAAASHPGDAGSLLQLVDDFYQPGAGGISSEETGLRPSHVLLTTYYFVNFFFVANYYGNVLKIRNLRMTKLGEASTFTAEAVNNTVALGSGVTSVLASLLFVGVDIKMLSIFTAILTAGVAAIFKDLLTNVAAGILLILHGDIKERDVLEIDGLGVGVVQKITLRHTVIADRNEISVLVPNLLMLKNKIRHFTYNGKQTRLTADIGIGYDADIDKAIAIMYSVCFHVDRVLATPKPTVQIRSTNDYDITLRLCFWVDTPDLGIGNVKSEVMYYLITEFAKNGVIIPYPVVEVRNPNSPGKFPKPTIAKIDPHPIS